MIVRLSRLLPLAIVLTCPIALHAQATSPDSVVRLPDVVRRVSREAAARWNLAGALTGRSTDEALRASGRVEEMLSGIPGLLAQSRSGGLDLRLTIRGFGSRGAGDRSNAGTTRGIRILIDGFPETEPDGRTSLDLVDLGAISHVDVLRSNGSASWGNAAGGVIAFSTRPALGQRPITTTMSGGGFGFRRAVTTGVASLGESVLHGTVTRTVSDGWRANSGGERTLGSVAWRSPESAPTTVGVFVTGTRNQYSIPGPLTAAQVAANPRQANAAYLARRERRDNTLARVGTTIAHRFGNGWALSTSGFVTDKHLERSERGTYRFFDRTYRGGSLLAEKRFARGGTTTFGGDLTLQDGPARFWSLTSAGEKGTTLQQDKNEWARNLGAFVQHDMPITGRIDLSLGARWDAIDYRYFDAIRPTLNDAKRFARVTPKVGATYRLASTHLLYASVGGGVEAPAGNETDPPGTFGLDTITGLSPLLEPIRSTSYEVGVRRTIAPSSGILRLFSYDVALYQTDVRNEVVPYRGGRFYFTAGQARRRGLETSAMAHLVGGLEFGGSVTLQDHRYIEYLVDSVHYDRPGHFADYSGNRVVGSPDAFMNGDVRWNPWFSNTLRLSAGVQAIGGYFADDANRIDITRSTTVSASIGMRRAVALGGGLGLRGAVTVNNLFNRATIASAFLNPDLVGGVPAAYEPGLPRHAVVSFTIDWADRDP